MKQKKSMKKEFSERWENTKNIILAKTIMNYLVSTNIWEECWDWFWKYWEAKNSMLLSVWNTSPLGKKKGGHFLWSINGKKFLENIYWDNFFWKTPCYYPNARKNHSLGSQGMWKNLIFLVLSVTKWEMEEGNVLWYCFIFNLISAGLSYFKLY